MNLLSTSQLLIILGVFLTPVACSVPAINPESANPEPVTCDQTPHSSVITTPLLSVLTLNLAHGRKDALNQMLQKSSTTRSNLEEIADFLSDSGADLVALQEADSASRWSGKFNHVEYISGKSPYPCSIHAHHATKYMYDFGTALLSRVPYTRSLSHTFAPSPPTTNKGFVMGQVLWNPGGQFSKPINVSVISVHLDFSRKSVREAQTAEMQAMLPDISKPIIILGDFNTDWSNDDSALKAIVANGNFKVYQPEATGLGTYKSGKHRLDWILISNDLEFVSYEVPQIVLSDHQPVQASLKLADMSYEDKDDNRYESNSNVSQE
ncbi:MAG: endonuclease/exonuclease/phosphatase family protein [Desulfuromusa sp.]|nr:endonuclease/exonuclease/phosphatase family protein [Desulfuromusa sp.]